MKKGKLVHIHSLTSNFYPREMYAKRLSFLSVKVLQSPVCSCGRETLSHRLSAYRAPIIFQVLCHRNGHWKWLDAVHVRQISCLFTVPDTFSVCREEKCEFQKGTHSTESDRHQVNPLNSTEGSSSLRSPVTESLPNNKKPYLLWFCSNKHNNTCSTRLPFQA